MRWPWHGLRRGPYLLGLGLGLLPLVISLFWISSPEVSTGLLQAAFCLYALGVLPAALIAALIAYEIPRLRSAAWGLATAAVVDPVIVVTYVVIWFIFFTTPAEKWRLFY